MSNEQRLLRSPTPMEHGDGTGHGQEDREDREVRDNKDGPLIDGTVSLEGFGDPALPDDTDAMVYLQLLLPSFG